MARVVLDLELLRVMHCGLGQFCRHLGQAMLDLGDPGLEPVFLLPHRPQGGLEGRPIRSFPAAWWRREPVLRWIRPFASALRRRSCDLWHCTHQFSANFPLHASVPVVLTIHDLIFLRDKPPHVVRRRIRRLQALVDRSAVVTTGSRFAADEIRSHLRLGGRDLVVIPHGVCVAPEDSSQRRPGYLRDGPFLFTIGDIVPRKNFQTLVAFAARLPEYRVVIAGKKSNDAGKQLSALVAAAGLEERVLLPGIVSDAEAGWLYRNCEALLFPSLDEGFGLPVIGAMSCGRPVFSSAAGSLPEVGGGLAFYWHRFEPDEMVRVFREGMEQVRNDPAHGEKLRAYAAQFTWDRAAGQYRDVYRAALRARGPQDPSTGNLPGRLGENLATNPGA